MHSGNFKEAALGNMTGVVPDHKAIATPSDYVSSSQVLQPPFYTQANAAAGIGSGLIKATLSTSQQQAEVKNML